MVIKNAKEQSFFSRLSLLLLLVLFAILPSVLNIGCLHDTITEKTFVYFGIIAMLIGIMLVNLFFYNSICLRINRIDSLFSLWTIYTILNGLFHNSPVTARLYELYGLIALYIILRQVKPKNFYVLFAAIATGGIIQAIHGNLQQWGLLHSQHLYFKMTGAFFNSGPYAGYLASVFPVALGCYLFKSEINNKGWIGIIAPISIILIITVLPITTSRAALLAAVISSAIILFKRYAIKDKLNRLSTKVLLPVIILMSLLFAAGIFGMIKLKPDSANGRVLIWKVTSAIFADNPVFGIGFDKFKSCYMEAQADYFEKKPASNEIQVVADNKFCFNEYLQQATENGVIGIITVSILIFLLFRVKNQEFAVILLVAKAGLTSILVFALFSYPSQILPIKINFICFMALISSLSKPKVFVLEKTRIVCSITKGVFAIVLIAGFVFVFNKGKEYITAVQNWQAGYVMYYSEKYSESIIYYKNAYPALKTDGDFLTNYGKALNMAKEYEQTIEILQQAAKYFPNTIVYITLGDSYNALGQIDKAEKAFMRAWYMCPNRFYPKYLLAKLYDDTRQGHKAVAIAEELLAKKIKLNSTAIEEIREEMTIIINKYKNSK